MINISMGLPHLLGLIYYTYLVNVSIITGAIGLSFNFITNLTL